MVFFMQFELPFKHAHGFDGLYGLEVSELSPERVAGSVTVRDELKQPAGLVHGGVYAAIAESLASIATAIAVGGDHKLAMGLSNQTSFLRPIPDGTVPAFDIDGQTFGGYDPARIQAALDYAGARRLQR